MVVPRLVPGRYSPLVILAQRESGSARSTRLPLMRVLRSPGGWRERSAATGAVGLLGVGLALLLAAWVMATTPFAAPDEASHYLRALSIANGALVGPKVPYLPVPPGLTAAQLAWADKGTRAVSVPARLSPPDVTCMNGQPDVGIRGCVEATEVGNYQPLPYLAPAVALEVSHDATTGLYLSRLASALLCLGFILFAVAILWDGSIWSLLGFLGALTPMVLFVCSVVNPNGLELAACIAFAACVLRIARAPSQTSSRIWVAFAISGSVAILAWQLGPVFVLADLALGAGLLGRRGLIEMRRSKGRYLVFSMFALVTAVMIYLCYGLAFGVSHLTVGVSPILQSLHAGLSQLVPVLRDSVGTFGGLTVHLPPAADWIWWLLVASMVIGALWLGSSRDRWLLAVVVVVTLAFPVLFYAWVYRFTGFGLQGRYVLPAMVLIPLVAGEVIHKRREHTTLASHRLPPLIPGCVAALVAAFQAYVWWFNARAAAGAPDTIRFYVHATWSPPLGWLPWIAVAAIGSTSLLTFAALGTVATTSDVARCHEPT